MTVIWTIKVCMFPPAHIQIISSVLTCLTCHPFNGFSCRYPTLERSRTPPRTSIFSPILSSLATAMRVKVCSAQETVFLTKYFCLSCFKNMSLSTPRECSQLNSAAVSIFPFHGSDFPTYLRALMSVIYFTVTLWQRSLLKVNQVEMS